MKKNGIMHHHKCTLLLLCVLLPCSLFAQEQLTFIAERDTIVFSTHTDEPVVLRAGNIITSNSEVFHGQILYQSEWVFHLLMIFSQLNNRYIALAKDFRPINTVDVFGERIFIDYPMDRFDPYTRQTTGIPIAIGDVDTMWVPAYYRDVLVGQDRNRLIEILPSLNSLSVWDTDEFFPWYENTQANIQRGRAMFYNSVIRLGIGTNLAVRNIRSTNFGYIVDCIVSIHGWGDAASIFPESTFWDTYLPGDAVTLLLYLDGDYLDVYTSRGIFVGTFIRIGREFIAQYQSLIRTNIADLTSVQWPQRADGSTGIRPRIVVEDIALWVVAEELADGIVYGNGAVEIAAAPQVPSVVRFDTVTSTTPLWVWLAVAGGLAAVGGAVFAVRRKK